MAENNRRAGALRERLHFQRRGDGDDGMGGPPQPGTGEFATVFTASAGLRPRVGGEAVDAARLGGRQPFVMTVRYSQQMADVTPAWQLLDARNEGRVLSIISPLADPDGKNQWLECLVQEGPPS